MTVTHLISQGEVLDALRDGGWEVRENGSESRAQCPAHDGEGLNLAVGRTDRGGALVYCHSRGCDQADIFRALGLRGASRGKGRQPIRTHSYHGADGMVKLQKVKYVTYKDGLYGYEWATIYPNGPVKDDEKPLYQLRGVLAERDRVYITEGEKDADTLIKAGLTATCSDAGAGSWRPQYNEQLKHVSEVVIVADNDEAGMKGAAKVRAALNGKNPMVMVPPDSFKDVTDMYQAGLTVDDLEVMADAEIAEQGSPLRLVKWVGFFEADFDQASWLIEPIMLTDRMTNLHGPAGQGKSELVLYLVAKAVVERGLRILWLDREMTPGDLQERLEAMGFRDADLAGLKYAFYPTEIPPLDTPEGGEMLAHVADLERVNGVVLDSLSKFVEGDENDNETHTRMWNHTTLRLREQSRALLAIDHTGKDASKDARGGSAKKDNSDLYLKLVQTALGARLYVNKRRHTWVASSYELRRRTDPISYEVVGSKDLSPAIHAIVRIMDELDIPHDWGKAKVRPALAEEGHTGGRQEALQEAIEYRRSRDNWKKKKARDECAFCDNKATHEVTVYDDEGNQKQQRLCDGCQVPPQRRMAA